MTSVSSAGPDQREIVLSTAYTFQHLDGSKITVYSLAEFDQAACALLLYRLMFEGMEAREADYDIEFAGETADILVPEPESLDAILTFIVWDRAFLSDALEAYAEGNVLSGAHIVYEHIYQHVLSLFEEQWDEAAWQAKRLIEAGQMMRTPLGSGALSARVPWPEL